MNKLSTQNQVVCNLPVGLVGIYIGLLISFVIICILKPFNKSKGVFAFISIVFGVLYFIMLATGIGFFIRTLVNAASNIDEKDVGGFRGDFLDVAGA